jgi:hypothetical protein
MADQILILDRFIQAKPFDLRALLRVAGWGCAAAAALMLAVLSASVGSKHQTLATPATTQVPAATVQLTTRQTEPDKATRQLTEAVSGLAADRERLVARIATIERNLEDVTGSIKQQAAFPSVSAPVAAQTSVHTPTVAPTPAPGPAQASAAVPTSTPATASGPASTPRPSTLPALAPAPTAAASAPPSPRSNQSQPEKTTTPSATAPPPGAIAAAPTAPAAPPAATPSPEPASTRVANLPEASEPDTGKTRIVDFGLDIGGSTTFDGLRALWNSVRNNTADLFDDLHPMVAVRENKSRGVDLRLVVGPIASSEAATQMCATLLAARRFCQMTIFEGQPLPQASAVAEPDPRRPPPVAPTRTPSQSKAVRPPAPRP